MTFIFSIVIPVYVSDISFIYLFHIIAVLCESKNFVMHIFSLLYLFICHKFTQPCFIGIATTAVGTFGSRSQIVPDWSKEPWCICVGYAHWSVKKREWVKTNFIFLRTYSVSNLCVYRKTCTYTLRKL